MIVIEKISRCSREAESDGVGAVRIASLLYDDIAALASWHRDIQDALGQQSVKLLGLESAPLNLRPNFTARKYGGFLLPSLNGSKI